jgi:outer membrane biosynthesis protein TonB
MRSLRTLALALLMFAAPVTANAATNLLACDSVWPPSGTGGRESNAPKLISDGNVLFTSGDFHGAALKYVSASQSDADIVALHNLGAALEKLGQTSLGGQLCASAWVSILTKQTRAPIPENQLGVIQTGLSSGQWPQTPAPVKTVPPTKPPTASPTTPPPTQPPTEGPTARPSTPRPTEAPTTPPPPTPAPTPRPVVTLPVTAPPTSPHTPAPQESPTTAPSPTATPAAKQMPMIPLPTAAVDTGVGVFVGFLIGVALGVQAMRWREARRRAQARRVKLDVDTQDK